ncbi:hypothetical protein FQN60_000649 [Etheostoma spectabile]|uniref:F-box domain-containing protein n=1 Tax=Etheostoma spectabile TaxID=54343 RepID=A0A5J5D0Y1_9PERO|nr:hypothetical protein FQN60_000649 [Etheostoma spectabile]
MEWNRWPVNDAHSHPNTELHENLLREGEQRGSLDLAMALKDQDLLFHSIKMKKLFPELISVDEEEEEEKKRKKKQEKEEVEKAAAKDASSQTGKSFNMFDIYNPDIRKDKDEDEVEREQEPTQEEREATDRLNADQLESYSAWERMFSMEMGGCREAGEAHRDQGLSKDKGLGTLTEEDTADTCVGATASNSCKQGSSAHNASSTSSSCPAVKLKKKFEYGYVEPMKIISVRTFKTPTSFSAKQSRIRNPGFYKRESRAVDTSDLGVELEEMPVWEEVQKEKRGHLIAESVFTDALLQDEGTQTYNFLSAPFRTNTSLAELTAAKPLELHLQLQVESVTSRHNKASSAFTFLCGHTFQRREYGKHYKNSHSDIHMGVNGWFEQRCPLANLGCTYSQKRFQPSTQKATISYNKDLGCFSLQPITPVSLSDTSQTSSSSEDSFTAQRKRGDLRGGGEDSLSSLPFEVLCHIASFLDSLSLSQLALERGMVTLRWEKKTYSHGGAKWRVKQMVWQFSTLFSPVETWAFQDMPSMSEHLKVCYCYERESRTEKIHLPCIREEKVQNKTSCKDSTLVSLFQQKRIMM